MNIIIENTLYYEMGVAFKKLNITSRDKNESITADKPILFQPKFLQANLIAFSKKGSTQMKIQFRST